ncbi:sigma-54-dependent Fis family transcriptional regulator [Jiella pelagia]|uniref:Sigma 54-interacting transcriptional regulator n=1 Tax=Jiella pelagia TaxID=2986949 RepID=A0ABY7C137_9HYPH|nr:sigma 54-interacting transcriptional regulator [Jiella pelagia]WAP67550.1 sigma 54-interacting transcriptional regulator [Jiella pelagia]
MRSLGVAPGSDVVGAVLDDAGYDDRQTMRAWEDFLSCGEGIASKAVVRRVIRESWSRSASCGIDANGTEAPVCGDDGEVERLTLSNAELLAAARRPFQTIGEMLDGTGAMLVLADQDGVMIEAVGDRKTLHSGQDINLAIGGKWNEEAVGTNGIGTALWSGKPVLVHAAEHFCAGIKSWTCAGAPIRDPFDGSIIGVVDLSGHPSIFKPHNIALVMAAAREIEQILEHNQKEERARLLESFISLAPQYRKTDGLMILNERGRVVYSQNLVATVLEKIALTAFDGGEPQPRLDFRRIENSLAIAAGQNVDFHVNPLALTDGRRGAAVVFPYGERSLRPSATTALAAPQRIERMPVHFIVGRSETLLAAIDQALSLAAAPTTMPLLIQGETGVGKELFARLVHQNGPKTAKAAFVALNCGAVTRELFGSELFGHAPGAFTGATREGKPGLFEQAEGGTLSLDEIGEMPLEIQPYLLRVLEERVVRRIGDGKERPINVRLVASTNRDLQIECDAGRFRRDLYYRISVVTVHVPALRDRAEDIPLLVDHFSAKFASTAGCAPLSFSAAAMDGLMAYPWPGNVREPPQPRRPAARARPQSSRRGLRPAAEHPLALPPGPDVQSTGFRRNGGGNCDAAHRQSCRCRAGDLASGTRGRERQHQQGRATARNLTPDALPEARPLRPVAKIRVTPPYRLAAASPQAGKPMPLLPSPTCPRRDDASLRLVRIAFCASTRPTGTSKDVGHVSSLR